MTQKRKTGMRLRQAADSRKNTQWLSRLMISLSGCTAMILTMAGLAGFRFGSTLLIMLLTGGVFCGVYALLEKLGRRQWFAPGVLAVLLLLTLIFRQQVLEGWRLYWNQLGYAMTEGRGWVLPQLQTQLSGKEKTVSISVFAVLTAGAIAWFSCLLSTFAVVLSAIVPILLYAGMTFLGTGAEFSLLPLVLSLSMLILLCGTWRKGNLAVPTVVSWLICGIAAVFAVQTLATPAVRNWAEEISDSIGKNIHAVQYETEHTTLPEGDFTDYRIAPKKAVPALKVTMDKPEVLYLRGFTGSFFSEDVWHEEETENLAKNRDLLYWLNLNAFTPDSQFSAAAKGFEMEENTIAVENLGACSRYLYVPFSLCDGDYLYKENLNTDGAFGDGKRSYRYKALTGGADAISRVLESLQTAEDEQTTAYRKAESAYRQIVYSQYLQVPEEAKELLGKHWNKLAAVYGGVTKLTVEQAQECALRFLGSCFPESGIPEELELPLDQARGTPYQYATVAVLTMRYFGIPARYAEGYRIPEQLVNSGGAGKTMTVDSSCAWAWADIYQDGVGWLPADLTPGLGDMIEEQPDNTLDGDLELDREEEEDPLEEESDASTQTPEPLGGTVVRILKKSLVWLAYLLLVFVAFCIFLWLRRKKLLEKKQQLFRDENVANAVGWIIADATLLLEQMGISRENGSLRDITEPVNARFGEAYAANFEEIIRLNDRAVFSKRTMEESCRETALHFREETLVRMKKEVKWYRRVRLKWLQCLY